MDRAAKGAAPTAHQELSRRQRAPTRRTHVVRWLSSLQVCHYQSVKTNVIGERYVFAAVERKCRRRKRIRDGAARRPPSRRSGASDALPMFDWGSPQRLIGTRGLLAVVGFGIGRKSSTRFLFIMGYICERQGIIVWSSRHRIVLCSDNRERHERLMTTRR